MQNTIMHEQQTDFEPEYWDGEIWPSVTDDAGLDTEEFDDYRVEMPATVSPLDVTETTHTCRSGEGPPASIPDPTGAGLHPLVYRGSSRRRSRNPTVGDAQILLNEFISRFDAGVHNCTPGANLLAVRQLRAAIPSVPIDVDCRFGPVTETAVKMFQQCTFPGDPRQWDGKIGPVTWPPLEAMRTPRPVIPPVVPPVIPPVIPPPTVPVDIQEIIRIARGILGRLPLGPTGIVLPTNARFLTAAEQTRADTAYSGSIDFTKVVITDGLGGSGRAFTTFVPTSSGDFVAMNMGPGPFATPLSNARLLIHELAHCWQSQHNGTSPAAFMTNSLLSQAEAIKMLPGAKASASARAVAAAVRRGVRNPLTLASIGRAAASAEDTSAYAYVPGRSFGNYAAEQIAEQVEHHFMGRGSPTPSVIAHIQSLAPHVFSAQNNTSLSTARAEASSTPGVVFP